MTDEELKKLDEDYQSRYKIINSIDRNVFVEASAGSGKTTQLVKRMIAMVEAGVDVSKICTITFTKVAANEFYEKFQALLSERMNPSNENEPLMPGDLPYTTPKSRKLCAEALEKIDLCFMGTIDSFCNMIAKEHPMEIQIPSVSGVIDEETQQKEILKVYEDIFDGKYGDNNKKELLEFKRHFRNGQKVFSKVMPIVLENRDKESNREFIYENDDKILNSSLDDLTKKIIVPIRELIEFIIEFGNRKTKKGGYIASASKNKLSTIEQTKNLLYHKIDEKGEDILSLVKNTLSLEFNGGIKDDPDFNSSIFTLKKDKYIVNNKCLEEIKSTISRFLHGKAMKFATLIIDDVCKCFREKGILTYFDYIYYLRNALKEDAKNAGLLANHIFEKHSYFLLDESQDTNPMQTELFFYITATNHTENWEECNPKQGSLFIVGDPKQSIYRFRGADVGAYNHIRELFEKKVGDSLPMTRNFRSNNSLKRYFNDVMGDLLNTNVEACNHKDIPIEKNDEIDTEDPTIVDGVFKYYSTKDGKLSANDKDAEQICQIIKQLVKNPKYNIVCGENKTKRLIEYSDFLVITKNTSQIKRYQDKFIKNNIPFESEGMTMFEKSKTLVNTFTYLKCIANPNDKNALVELLTSDLYNLTTYDISTMCFAGVCLNLYDNNTCSNAKVNTILNEIRNVFNKTKGMSYSTMFQYIINNVPIFKKCSLDYMNCLFYANEIIREKEIAGQITNSIELNKIIASINSNMKDYERPMKLAEKLDSVKIANVHKVKGAQAPIVILAQPEEPGHNDRLYVDRANNRIYLIEVNEKVGDAELNILSTDKYPAITTQMKKCRIAENRRIQYVAATRAKCVLIISNYLVDSEINSSWIELEKTNEYEIKDFPFENADKEVITSKTEKDTFLNDGKIASNEIVSSLEKGKNDSYKIILPSTLKKKKDKNDTERDLSISVKLTKEQQNAMLIGTLVHRLMECIINSNKKYNIADLVNEIVNDYNAIKYKDLLIKVADTVINKGGYEQNGVKVDIVKEVLESDKYYCEVPFAFEDNTNNEEKNIINGVIDLIYKKDNKWHIIDYKTNYEDDIVKLKEEYQRQLDAYIKAFKSVSEEEVDVDANIYHIEV